jgi:hypothetical protein
MELWKNFIDNSIGLKNLLDAYLKLRLHLQSLGFTEKQLERPPRYTKDMMDYYAEVGNHHRELYQQLQRLGFDVEKNEYDNYIIPILNKINEITPLKNDVDTERDDTGNEDY